MDSGLRRNDEIYENDEHDGHDENDEHDEIYEKDEHGGHDEHDERYEHGSRKQPELGRFMPLDFLNRIKIFATPAKAGAHALNSAWIGCETWIPAYAGTTKTTNTTNTTKQRNNETTNPTKK